MKFPEAFIKQLEELLGEEAPAFFAALDKSPTTSVRINTMRGANVFPDAEKIPWSDPGRILKERPSFTLDPLLHAGAYYVQDASSQFLDFAIHDKIDTTLPLTILDACAAPGGKTLGLLQLLAIDGVLISNEIIGSRAKILLENVWKWGDPNIVVTSADPHVLGASGLQVDLLVVDAPCSGEGLFRKNPDAVAEWSPAHVAHCAARQKRIVGDLWPTLKSGGLLFYSTCTWNKKENEEVLQWVQDTLGAERMELSVPPWGIDVREGLCRFLPHGASGEGFTCGVMRKKDAAAVKTKNFMPKEMVEGRKFLDQIVDRGIPVQIGKTVFAVPDNVAPVLGLLQHAKVPILSAGVPIGERHGAKEIKPHPMVTHSYIFSTTEFPFVELDYDQALAYLRRQDVLLDGAVGRVVVKHKGYHLGFGRAQNGRISSLYPMDYRIRRQ